MDLYSENILDHFEHPRNAQSLSAPTVFADQTNPLCGDRLRVELKVKKDIVAEVAFVGSGCAISQSAASMLSEEIKGKKISAIKKIKPELIHDLLKVKVGPGRIKCAMLGLSTLESAISKIKK